jgi:hypothetical protein
VWTRARPDAIASAASTAPAPAPFREALPAIDEMAERALGPLRMTPVPPPVPAAPPPARPTLSELCDETVAALDVLARATA